MRRVHLEAAEDHVERLARENDPVGAVKELVWNALDADATRVEVLLDLSDLGGVEKITVIDNGSGITPEGCDSAFERIGGSWKKMTRRTPQLNRFLHGSAGQGRLRGYALGDHIRWATVADGIDGRRRVVIRASATARNDFEISTPQPTDEPTGTTFEAWGRQSKRLEQLKTHKAVAQLTTELATYLAVYQGIEVIYDGQRIDPEKSIQRRDEYELSFTVNGEPAQAARLRVVEWSMKTDRELHLCDADGITIDITDVGIRAPGFTFTAYVLWEAMPEHQGDFLLGEGRLDSHVGALITAARDKLREHFKLRAVQQRREVVQQWKEDGVYPYAGDAATETDALERETFDLVATTVHRQIPRTVRAQRTTLALLREAVRHQPDNMHDLLDEVFKLSTDDKNNLKTLLDRTSLATVIKASTSVSDRLTFLTALQHMVFDPEVRRVLKERSQLHKILENEVWVFGERFNLLVSDRSLDAVLDRHLHAIGREIRNQVPVRRPDGRVGIVDLMLSRARREHDRHQHLVVELKAPHVTVGHKEINQIEDYALAVVTDPQFADVRVEWDFWLVTTDMTEVAKAKAQSSDRPPGCIGQYQQGAASVRVWLRSWAQIIDNCRDRLKYFQEQFAHDPTVEQAMEYLHAHHNGQIPQMLVPGQSAGPVSGDTARAATATAPAVASEFAPRS
ncbi:ATP-binding protein [Micromonospora sp. NPDC053740]|uniref:ATP-binding protein n=1 Tax=Micromonospora sp. NPDC053740 TaxID=3155173 RepID=UPI003440373A